MSKDFPAYEALTQAYTELARSAPDSGADGLLVTIANAADGDADWTAAHELEFYAKVLLRAAEKMGARTGLISISQF